MKLLLLVGLCAVLYADQYVRQPGIDVQHYVFKVTLSDDTDEIEGETTIRVKFVRDDVTKVAFDLGSGMTVLPPLQKRGETVEFLLDLAPKKDEIREFLIPYRGKPAGGLKVVKNLHGDRCVFSTNWPDLAHQWLPTIDHPYDKATGEFLITAPSQYAVVANGLLVEERDLPGGKRLTHWKQSVPIATWLFNIGAAPFASTTFATVGGIPLQTWVFRQDRERGAGTFESAARRAMDFYASAIGPYPYEKLAHVQAAGMGGGMEHASAIFYGEKVVTGLPANNLVAHETAHQWFGDSVTEKDWDDVWLSEGFATYFANLTTERYDGREAFETALKKSRDTIFTSELKLPGVAVVQNGPWKGIPNGIVYQKGGWALHMLRGQIGSEKFWEGIRLYYKRFRDSNASTDDFRQAMEEVSGQDLGWWFQQWLYRPGSPKIEGGWRYTDGRVVLDIEQTQPGDPYRIPLEVLGSKLEMTQKRQRFEIPAARPDSVTLDPNTWILADFSRWESRGRK
jgi:aminopeptidase N